MDRGELRPEPRLGIRFNCNVPSIVRPPLLLGRSGVSVGKYWTMETRSPMPARGRGMRSTASRRGFPVAEASFCKCKPRVWMG